MFLLTEAFYCPTEFFTPKWAEEMVQHIRAINGCSSWECSPIATAIWWFITICTPVSEDLTLFWPLCASGMQVEQIIHALTHKIKISKKSVSLWKVGPVEASEVTCVLEGDLYPRSLLILWVPLNARLLWSCALALVYTHLSQCQKEWDQVQRTGTSENMNPKVSLSLLYLRCY